jgi:hypothetical protein
MPLASSTPYALDRLVKLSGVPTVGFSTQAPGTPLAGKSPGEHHRFERYHWPTHSLFITFREEQAVSVCSEGPEVRIQGQESESYISVNGS